MSDALWWLGAGAVLAGAELIVPGVFLIFLAAAAAITALLTLALPAMGLAGELVAFAAWSVVAVLIGRRWYRDYPVESADPLLNDRAARLVGARVSVTQAIAGGAGRVRLGDGDWPARGPDAGLGSAMRVTAVEDGVLVVEPV